MSHIVSFKILLRVFLALVILTVLTVAVSEINFGRSNLIIALTIAVIKASLVVLFFMHLFWDKTFYAVVFIGCLIFVCLFIGLALLDSSQYQSSIQQQQAPGVKHVPMGSHSR